MWSCKLLLRGQLASCEFIQFFIHAGKNTVLSGTNNSLGTRLGRYAVEMERGTRQIYSLEIWISNINRPANNCQGNSDISVKWRTKGGSREQRAEVSGSQRRDGPTVPGMGFRKAAQGKALWVALESQRHWDPRFLATAATETAVNYSPIPLGRPMRLFPAPRHPVVFNVYLLHWHLTSITLYCSVSFMQVLSS